MKLYRCKVLRINSRRKSEKAKIRMVQGNKVSFGRIEVSRLMAAKVAYCGASFFFCVSDRGATRTITIKPNKSANQKLAEECRRIQAEDEAETAGMKIAS